MSSNPLTKQVSFYAYAPLVNNQLFGNVAFSGSGQSATLPIAASAPCASSSLQIGQDEETVTQVVKEAVQSTAGSVALNVLTAGVVGDVETVYHLVSETVPNTNPNAESFTWQANVNNSGVLSASVSIDPVTGNLANTGPVSNGVTLNSIGNTPAVIVPNQYAVSYGFFDASAGWVGLTNADQSYVYVTPCHTGWMGALARQYPQVNNAPFNNFVLAGAHDAGMSYQTQQQMLSWLLQTEAEVAAALILFAPSVFSNVVFDTAAVAAIAAAPQILRYLAFTQKDTVSTMLNLGVRYFDFRPGYCYGPLQGSGIFHQHLVIPGNSFSSFMTDVVNWLLVNPTEIVVVSLGFSGFESSSMQPSAAALWSIITPLAATRVGIGSKASLGQTYAQLIATNTRLIFLNSSAVGDNYAANPYDSYFHGNYETTNPQNVIDALNTMNAAGFAPNNVPAYDYTVLQLQGTAQGSASNGFSDFLLTLSTSQAASPLMSTKAQFDSYTYPWLLTYARQNMDYNGATPPQPVPNRSLIVLLNDFCDNAAADIAVNLTLQRCCNPA